LNYYEKRLGYKYAVKKIDNNTSAKHGQQVFLKTWQIWQGSEDSFEK